MGVRQIGLFGSQAMETAGAKSDIDLLLDFDPKQEKFDDFLQVIDLCEQMFHLLKVDVVSTNGLSRNLGPYLDPKLC